MNDKGLFGTFDYDRWKTEPPIEQEHHDTDAWYLRNGEWVRFED